MSKSLVQPAEWWRTEPRFRLLETVREFAMDQLEASGELTEARAAMAVWAIDLARRGDDVLRWRHDQALMNRLEDEHATLLASLEWLAAGGQSELLLRLASHILWPWFLADRLRDGRIWLARALAATRGMETSERAFALYGDGLIAHHLSRDEEALARLDDAATLARRIGDRLVEGYVQLCLGIIAEHRGDYQQAQPLLLAGCDGVAQADDRRGCAVATYHLGLVAAGQGDSTRSEALLREALTMASAINDPMTVAWCLGNFGLQAADRGDVGMARAALEERLSVGFARGEGPGRDPQLLRSIAVLGVACGAMAPAARLSGAARRLIELSGEIVGEPERSVLDPAADLLRRALGEEAYDRLVAEGRSALPDVVNADVAAVFETARAVAGEGAQSVDPKLTPREREILRLLVDGRSNPEIAAAPSISHRTVTTHVTNILAKLGVTTRTEAAARAVRDDLV